ncbi:ribokinase [Kitasatospora sp. NPDC057223]|uniref:ribokinase n=1 Tax=Kitasatospora sp. NPDC057223 TaxID=3346055 RepID=UPI00364430E1
MDSTGTAPDLVVVGSANADIVVRVERLPEPGETVRGSEARIHPGGKGANQAAAAARLGARVVLLARVGEDAHGALLLGAQRAAGVDTSRVLTGGAPTGVALITVGPDGDNTIVVSPGANARLSVADVRAGAALLAAAPVVSLQLEIALESVVEVVRTVGAATRVVFNPSPFPSPFAPLPAELLTACDPLVVNEHEARLVLGGSAGARRAPEESARALLALGARSVVVTLGAHGAVVADARGSARLAAPRVEAVDSTGAGDAFTGALAWRLGAGDDLATAARFAVRVGAATVTRHGAQSSYPTPEELAALRPAADSDE